MKTYIVIHHNGTTPILVPETAYLLLEEKTYSIMDAPYSNVILAAFSIQNVTGIYELKIPQPTTAS